MVSNTPISSLWLLFLFSQYGRVRRGEGWDQTREYLIEIIGTGLNEFNQGGTRLNCPSL